jgi:hypothetical protein
MTGNGRRSNLKMTSISEDIEWMMMIVGFKGRGDDKSERC